MGKRYYCDYCDRSFADSANNRKNHFKGGVHQRLRKQHYDSFKDAAARLADESSKPPCKRFMSTGSCDYGDDCRYSHMTPAAKQELLNQAEKEKAVSSGSKRAGEAPTLERWLAKREKRLKQDDGAEPADSDIPKYELPPFLAGIANLPPSLLPPTAEDLRGLNPVDWG